VQLSLADRVIVVIGGTSGLGLSAARACAASGAKLVVVGRDEQSTSDATRELGAAAVAITADATKPETAPTAIARAIEAFGGFHGLYHVAGGSGRRAGDGPLHEISDDGWQFTLDLNLTSLFYSNRAAARQFTASGGGGVVLNMGSVLASSPSPRYFATHAYAAAKSAVIGFTRSCAAFYAAKGIRFNVIAPGLVETPMSRRACSDDNIRRLVEARQPLEGGRIGQPADLDAAAVYLLSDASRFVTGQVLSIDGGWSVSDGSIVPAPGTPGEG
jgi:NAD(P)-dependent dehydrogenase (short-subunit alcohol dehydrogenase family)